MCCISSFDAYWYFRPFGLEEFNRSEMDPPTELLTEQEAAVYDRQIRVWGVDAQRKYVSDLLPIVTMGDMV